MCGICGFVGPKDEQLLQRMTGVLSHRGPDEDGFYISPPVSFGHRRLSIIDLSKKGRQPMFNEDKTVVLTFNGEVFNFQELREKLIKNGHRFFSRTDTEVIVHGYEEWGIKKTVGQLRGFFAFALWDRKKGSLFLVRDRIGVKPLYYSHQGNELFFASEIKSLLENKNIKRMIDEKAYWLYLTFQASLGEQTIFSGIKKVPPATIITFRNSQLFFDRYWSIKKEASIAASDETEKEDHFRKLLLEAVRIRLVADVPLGVLLSGGLDSSAIVALMVQVTDQPIKTFSVGFGETDDELKFARLVARKYRTEHQEIIIRPKKIQEVLEKIVWHQDEPLADGGGMATYLTAKEVSKAVKVVLVGEGGDELFGGYSWYRLGLSQLNLIPELLKKEIYFYLTTFFRGEEGLGKYGLSKIKKGFSAGKEDFLSKMMRFEIENVLPNSLCMKVDKMTSAWGLEAREPFLDQELAEFCFSLPAEDKISLTKGKVLFRKVMKDFLPPEILARRKHGFLLPTEKWLNGDLGKFAKELLLTKNSHALSMHPVAVVVNLFEKKKYLAEVERINLLWRLFIFELWFRIYSR
jgi:asparagine synthase (glutamine-hydrolysing)